MCPHVLNALSPINLKEYGFIRLNVIMMMVQHFHIVTFSVLMHRMVLTLYNSNKSHGKLKRLYLNVYIYICMVEKAPLLHEVKHKKHMKLY